MMARIPATIENNANDLIIDVNEPIRDTLYKIHDFGQKFQYFLVEIDNFHLSLRNGTNDKYIFDQFHPTDPSQQQLMFNESQRFLLEKIQIFHDYFTTFCKYTEIVDQHLKNWHKNQALAGNGGEFVNFLDEIQICIENSLTISQIIITACKMLKVMITKLYLNETIGQDLDQKMMFIINVYQQNIIRSALVVEKHPLQVIKKGTKFSASIRWLIGEQFEHYKKNFKVECSVLSEKQVQYLYDQNMLLSQILPGQSNSATPISENKSNMKYDPETRHFTAEFKSMQVKDIKREDKKAADETVTDKKFALLFIVYDEVLNIKSWTLSLPIVLIVHNSQEPESWATIIWDNGFSDIGRKGFEVPDEVEWNELENVLNMKFYRETGRKLTEQNFNFLFDKLFNAENINSSSCYHITWKQFAKENLKRHSFPFWKWLYSTMKLIKDSILKEWQADLINGYISKQNTEEILHTCPDGTFIIRFAESELGGLSFAVVKDDEILHLVPVKSSDLSIYKLADRLRDFSELKYLYLGPNIYVPKENVFGKFYSQRDASFNVGINGYVKPKTQTTIPTITKNSTIPRNTIIQSPELLSLCDTLMDGVR